MKQIPGLSLGESSLKSTHYLRCRKPSRNKPDWELRRLAFNFPKQTSTGPDIEQKKKCKAKPRQGKVLIRHWGTEEVSAQVRKLLMRKCSQKPVRKRENKKKVIAHAKKPLGKFGRGDAPHEYWEEERRIREKKKSKKLAKTGKPKPEVRSVPILTDEPLIETEKEEVEIQSKSSSLRSSNESEQEEKKQMDLGSTYIEDDRSHKVLNNVKSKVQTWREDPSLTSSSESEEEEETQMDLESFHIKDMKSNKVFPLKSKTMCSIILTDSDSDAEEEVVRFDIPRRDKKGIDPNGLKDLKSNYIKDVSSHKVLHKSRIQSLPQQPMLSDLENDSGSQFGDDDSDYKENENDESRKKTLKRGRGGAAPGEWQEMAEEERMRMVAIKRNKMVRIAQQVKMSLERNYVFHKKLFDRVLPMRTYMCELPSQIVQQGTVFLNPQLTSYSLKSVADTSLVELSQVIRISENKQSKHLHQVGKHVNMRRLILTLSDKVNLAICFSWECGTPRFQILSCQA